MAGFAAVVLAGGAARRMGGADKPALPVGGRSMLTRVLAAVADAEPRIVVGPAPADLPAGVRSTLEQPPGGGPVAAIAAGLALVPEEAELVAILAADLPLLTGDAVTALRRAMASDATVDGALYRDADGRRQLLCGVWRTAALRAAVDRLTAPRTAGTSDAAPLGAGPLGGDPSAAGQLGIVPPSAGPRAAGSSVTGPRAAGSGVARPLSDEPVMADGRGRAGRGASVRRLVDGLTVVTVDWERPGPPPWFDCDTDADLRRAREWTDGREQTR